MHSKGHELTAALRRYAVALSSGTAALHLALLELGAGPGKVVIVPTMTFAATANAVVYAGATPVSLTAIHTPAMWIPISSRTYYLSLQSQGEHVAAVIAVDLLGIAQTTGGSVQLPKCRNSFAFGCRAGSRSQARRSSCRLIRHCSNLRFNGNKVISTSGGGVLLTDDERFAERVRYLSTQARQPVAHYEHTEIGYNYRLSNVSAALGLAQLERLDEMIARRRRWREGYSEIFADVEGVGNFQRGCESEDNCWLTAILVDPVTAGWKPAELAAVLGAAGIESRPLVEANAPAASVRRCPRVPSVEPPMGYLQPALPCRVAPH